jgi:hypothetical protein
VLPLQGAVEALVERVRQGIARHTP